MRKARILRDRYFPSGSRRGRAYLWFTQIARVIIHWLAVFAFRIRHLIHKPSVFEDLYTLQGYSQVVLFTNQKDIFPNYPFRETFALTGKRTSITLIATTFNESGNASQWLESMLDQTRAPDEIIIVDAGSTDGTAELLTSLAAKSPVPIKVICEPGVNIARGRNLAIRQANHPIIAVSDFGCRPDKDWLENIIHPFEQDDQIQVAGGWYVVEDRAGKVLRRGAWPSLDQVDPEFFVPSSRSIAFTKEIWEQAQGYPEWLTLTGEDTYFAMELSKYCSKRAFVPNAVVHWIGPEGYRDYWKKIFYWSVGDGESGLHGPIYWYAVKLLLLGVILLCGVLAVPLAYIITHSIILPVTIVSLIILGVIYSRRRYPGLLIHRKDLIRETGARFAQVSGFLYGARNRSKATLKRFQQANGLIFILAGVPIYDTGGGSRGSQLALEFLLQHYIVIYIHKFGSYESIDLGIKFHHPNLIVSSLAGFSWDKFIQQYGSLFQSKICGALIEFPLRDFLPVIRQLKSHGAVIGYDLLDNWDSQLGAAWFDRDVEREIVSLSDRFIATTPGLADELQKKAGKYVHLLPNAVNLRRFDHSKPYLRPADLPSADFVITYIGALWGNWFDWDLLVNIARTYSTAEIVIIGDYRGQCPVSLPNLHFLGLKPQASLPPYLAYSDVAMIPWKENEITYATSPLKLYEYLAMNVPVVTPCLPLLKGIPYVYLSTGVQEFLDNIALAAKNPIDRDLLAKFIQQNSWEYRVKEVTKIMVTSSTSKQSEKPSG